MRSFSTGIPGLFFATVLTAHGASFDATLAGSRTLITNETVATLAPAAVSGGFGGTRTPVRMFYDASDQTLDSFFNPLARRENLWNQEWRAYLLPSSALGSKGPIGALGPLGAQGPLGTGAMGWNPSTLPGSYNYRPVLADLSSVGPLGGLGPLTSTALYTQQYHLGESGYLGDESVFDFNDFQHQLDPSGVWGILGPVGPLGALGPLGPLGVLGFGKGNPALEPSTGNYYIPGMPATPVYTNLLRKVEVRFDTTSRVRTFDLMEFYARRSLLAQQANPSRFLNDTSFTVNALAADPAACDVQYKPDGSDHTYYFYSEREQWVSVLIVPAVESAGFGGEGDAVPFGPDGRGRTSIREVHDSEVQRKVASGLPVFHYKIPSGQLQPYALYRARPDELHRFTVKADSTSAATACGYLLHVVGSAFVDVKEGVLEPDLFGPRHVDGPNRTFNVFGPHQKPMPW
nr:hypothetical protein [uncultured Rhodoferax sp.]